MSNHKYNDNNYEQRVTRLEVLNETICDTLIRLETKIDVVAKEIKESEERMNSKIDSNFRWVIGTVLVTFGGITLTSSLTLIAKLLHWIT